VGARKSENREDEVKALKIILLFFFLQPNILMADSTSETTLDVAKEYHTQLGLYLEEHLAKGEPLDGRGLIHHSTSATQNKAILAPRDSLHEIN
jgi:hypothetical protein